MSGKSMFAALISFMTLFALAAQAREPAGKERAAVIAAVRSGNQAAYARALERYNDRLTLEFAPKKKGVTRSIARHVAVLPEAARAQDLSAFKSGAEDVPAVSGTEPDEAVTNSLSGAM